MTEIEVQNAYFDWMYDRVCGDRYSKPNSYRKLLFRLHNIDFRYKLKMDSNRYEDGISLRYRFAYEHSGIKDAERYLKGPCSVLEMMVALAIICEERIMDDPAYGDRTGQWFWQMVNSLGLGAQIDSRFDREFVDETIDIFLKRKYQSDGRGGLFTIKNCNKDLRKVEIWWQLMWYLDTFV